MMIMPSRDFKGTLTFKGEFPELETIGKRAFRLHADNANSIINLEKGLPQLDNDR